MGTKIHEDAETIKCSVWKSILSTDRKEAVLLQAKFKFNIIVAMIKDFNERPVTAKFG